MYVIFSAASASQVVYIGSNAMNGEIVSREYLSLLALVLLSCGGPQTSVTDRTSSPSPLQLIDTYQSVSQCIVQCLQVCSKIGPASLIESYLQ